MADLSAEASAAPAAEQAAGLCGRLLAVARDIKLSHTVFALPFALLAMFLAAGSAQRLPTLTEGLLILLCMVFARTAAMAMNRWADARFDAANARTAARAIPAGRVSRGFVMGVFAGSGLAFIASAGGFWLLRGNVWPVLLSPLVLGWLAGYSFTKRFTALCHVYLGIALAISPIAATIAIEPGYLAWPGVWLLSGMVACWVAGFDIIYARQDMAVDADLGLFSLPSRLGTRGSMWVSRCLHLVAGGLLIGLSVRSPQLGVLFAIAVGVTALLLVAEHVLIAGGRERNIPIAFATVNGVISIVLGAAGIADVVLR